MREIPIGDLPPLQFFWRSCGERWYKLDEVFGNRTSNPDAAVEEVEFLVSFPDLQEVVLSDPTKCDSCWNDLYPFPPPLRCQTCGAIDESRSNLDSLRARISKWAGVARPHI